MALTSIADAGPVRVAAPRPSARLRWFRGVSLALLVASGLVNMIDRSTLAVAAPLVRQDLGLSISDMGLLLSAFLWTYAVAQLPIGALVDRGGPRILLTCGQILWSLAQASCGLVNSFGQFVVARMVLGVGEAPQLPPSARVVRDCYRPSERGLPTGIFLISSQLGPAIALPLITWLMLLTSWREMFAITGVAGIVVAAVWFTFYRDPATVDFTAEERLHLPDENGRTAQRITFAAWRSLFGHRTTWGLTLGYAGMGYIIWVYTAWLPSYLQIERHMSIPRTGLVAAIPFLCGALGGLVGGKLVDRLAAAGVAPLRACKYQASFGLAAMALFTGLVAVVPDNTSAIVLVCCALFTGLTGVAASWAMVSIAAEKNAVASLGSLMNCGAYCGGALAPTVTGYIVESAHSFVPALLTSTVIGLVAAACYLFGVTKPLTGPQV